MSALWSCLALDAVFLHKFQQDFTIHKMA